MYDITVSIKVATSDESFLLVDYMFASILLLGAFAAALRQTISQSKISYLMYQKLKMTC
jgi:hypothetical protein